MKYMIAAAILILFSVDASAQASNKIFDSLANITMIDLQDSWTLGIDSNNDAVDVRIYNKFKNLFDSSATIADDVNVFYHFDAATKQGNYQTYTSLKNFELYAHDIALQIKSITINADSITSANANSNTKIFTVKRRDTIQKTRQFVISDASDFANKLIQSRSIKFEKHDEDEIKKKIENELYNTKDAVYKFTSVRTLQITIKFNDADSSCKIIAVKNLSKEPIISCLNDDDKDGILNQDDILPKTPGDFTANGSPDNDFDGVPDKNIDGKINDKCPDIYGAISNQGCPTSYFSDNKEISGYIGLQQNAAKINLPELNDLGYRDTNGNNAVDVLQSKKGALQNPANKTGFYAGGNIAYYFGKRKRAGISVGVTYAGFKVSYLLTEPIVYTFKANDGVDDYRRQITINNLSEEITYNVFNFPVLFNYRLYADKHNKSVINLKPDLH